jgi:hypothetical protein
MKTLLFIIILSSSLFCQFNYDRYKPARLDTVSFFPVQQLNDSVYFFLADDEWALKVKVIYSDSVRKIDLKIKKVLTTWIEEVAKSQYPDSLLHTEILFYDHNKPIWIPVQESLIQFLKDEVSKGDIITLYVVIAGATKDRQVFLLNEFDTTNE